MKNGGSRSTLEETKPRDAFKVFRQTLEKAKGEVADQTLRESWDALWAITRQLDLYMPHSFDELCHLENTARELTEKEMDSLQDLVHRTRVFDNYRPLIGFGPENITAEVTLEELLADYKSATVDLPAMCHDLLRVDISASAGNALYRQLPDAIRSRFYADDALYGHPFYRDSINDSAHTFDKNLFYGTVLGLLGETYENPKQADLFLKTTSQTFVEQSSLYFFERPQGCLPPTEKFFPTALFIAQHWLAANYFQQIEASKENDEFLVKLLNMPLLVAELSQQARQILLETELLTEDFVSNSPEYISQAYRRLDPTSPDNRHKPDWARPTPVATYDNY